MSRLRLYVTADPYSTVLAIMAEPSRKKGKTGDWIKVVVTGGTGLVGKALEEAIAADPRPNEEWVFLSSKDGDLR